MYHRSAVNYLMSYKNIECLLRRNFSVGTNQTCRKPTRCFLSTFQRSNTCINVVNHRLTHLQNLINLKFMSIRNFSTSKKLFNQGSNDKEERQVRILATILTALLLFCLIMSFTMETHQDYVVIQPNEK